MQADVGIALVLTACGISRSSYRGVKQNVALAFTFNGIGIPWPPRAWCTRCGPWSPCAAFVTTIFINSIGGHSSLLFQAIASVGRTPTQAPAAPARSEILA